MYCLCTTLAGATHLWGPMLAGPHQSCQGSRPARTNPVRPPKVAEKLRQKRQRTVSRPVQSPSPRHLRKTAGATWQAPPKRVLSLPEREPAACSEERIRDPPLDLLRRWRPLGRHWCLWDSVRFVALFAQTAQKGCCAWSRRTHVHRRFSLPWRVSYLPDGVAPDLPNGT